MDRYEAVADVVDFCWWLIVPELIMVNCGDEILIDGGAVCMDYSCSWWCWLETADDLEGVEICCKGILLCFGSVWFGGLGH